LIRKGRCALRGHGEAAHASLGLVAFERDPEHAIIGFRKHLGWHTEGVPDGRRLRVELFQPQTLQDVERPLEGYLHEAGTGVGAGA